MARPFLCPGKAPADLFPTHPPISFCRGFPYDSFLLTVPPIPRKSYRVKPGYSGVKEAKPLKTKRVGGWARKTVRVSRRQQGWDHSKKKNPLKLKKASADALTK